MGTKRYFMVSSGAMYKLLAIKHQNKRRGILRQVFKSSLKTEEFKTRSIKIVIVTMILSYLLFKIIKIEKIGNFNF